MRLALDEIVTEGLVTNVPLHQLILASEGFTGGGADIHFLENWLQSGSVSEAPTGS